MTAPFLWYDKNGKELTQEKLIIRENRYLEEIMTNEGNVPADKPVYYILDNCTRCGRCAQNFFRFRIPYDQLLVGVFHRVVFINIH